MIAKFLTIAAAALLSIGVASANVVPTFMTVSGSGSLFTYSYSVGVDQFQYVTTGDELCFADVAGLTGTATGATGWTAAERTGTGCPINAGVTKPNVAGSVLYTYTGTATIPPSTVIGTFTFQDTIGTANGLIAFGATSNKVSDNQQTANQGEVVGPGSVPEPGTIAILGSGLLALGLIRRKRVTR